MLICTFTLQDWCIENKFWIMKHFADIATLLAKTKPTSEHSAYITLAFCFPKKSMLAPIQLQCVPCGCFRIPWGKGRRITPSYSCGRGLGTHVDMPAEQGRHKRIRWAQPSSQSYPNRFEQDCCGIPVDFSQFSSGWSLWNEAISINFMKIAMLRFDEQVSTNSCGLPQICCWKLRADRIYLRLQIPIADSGIIRSWM